jgi:hypothetical protein
MRIYALLLWLTLVSSLRFLYVDELGNSLAEVNPLQANHK